MTTELADFTCLEPGQALRMAVSPGFAVRVVEGSVRVVSSPSWLGETMRSGETTVHAEDVHVVERSGWIEIVARSAARVQVLPQPVRVRSVHGARLGRWVQFLAGRLAMLRLR